MHTPLSTQYVTPWYISDHRPVHSNTSHWLMNSQWWIWLVEQAVKSSKSSSSCCQYKTSLFLWILKWCSPSKPFSRINCFRYILQAATNFPLTLIRVLLTKSFVWCKIRNKTVFVQRKEIRFVPNFNELIFWFDSMTWHSTLPTESRFDSFIMNFYWQTVSIIPGLKVKWFSVCFVIFLRNLSDPEYVRYKFLPSIINEVIKGKVDEEWGGFHVPSKRSESSYLFMCWRNWGNLWENNKL